MLRMKRASGGGGGGGCCLNGGSRLDQYLIGKRQQQQQWRPIHARRPCGRDFSLRSRIAWAAGLHWSIPTETAAHRRGARASTPTLAPSAQFIHGRFHSTTKRREKSARPRGWCATNCFCPILGQEISPPPSKLMLFVNNSISPKAEWKCCLRNWGKTQSAPETTWVAWSRRRRNPIDKSFVP